MKKQYDTYFDVKRISFKVLICGISILCVIASPTLGQQVRISSGAYMNMSGAAYININNGDLINNGTFNKGTETVIFSGNTSKTISGSNNIDINNISITNTGGISTQLSQLTVNVLTIAASCKFTISPAKALIVNGDLTNNAGTSGFVLQSDASGTASLIHNTNNVPATVERYISGNAEDWHFLTSPVANQSISGSWLPSGTYGNGTGYDLYLWNEPNSCWIYNLNTTTTINWNTVHPGANFEIGRGYLYSVQATNPTKEFIGNLNNGSLDIGLTNSGTDIGLNGFNLIGNPYPSSIDWSLASGWTRSNLTNSGGGYNMWIWNPAVNNYGVYNSADGDGNGTNSVTKYIAPMQGFFVQAASAGTLSVNNTARVVNGANSWFKSSSDNESNSKLCISIISDEGFGADEVQLRFGYSKNENGAKKLFSKVNSAPNLYLPSNDKYYSINYFTNTQENLTVPLMFSPGINGSYKLNCNYDFANFDTIFLEDRLIHILQDMTLNKTYSFSASKSDNANRFVLHFGNIKNVLKNVFNAKIYTNGTRVIIDLLLVGKETNVTIYDIMGRVMYKEILQGANKHYITLNAHNQIIIVDLKNSEDVLCQKIYFEGN